MEATVASRVDGDDGAALPRPGVPVEVWMSRGRLATRPGLVLGVGAVKAAGSRPMLAVRWDDDGSVAWLVPGADIVVTPS
ncbi:MAG TPA: hypothetical protein VMU14_03320 [Acidimicrobiales bacterium]|nr:hypothetical protein [Acidimicrobiales bacterium]